MGATTSLLTFDEFERLPDPDEPGKHELLEGELIRLSPPEKGHMKQAYRFADTLKPLTARTAGLGDVNIEMGYRIGGTTWLVPDVSIEHPGQPGDRYLEGPPLLAIEIISPFNRAVDIDRKIKTYLANGSQEIWVAYPSTRCVWVFRAEGAQEFRGVLRSQFLPQMELDLESIFG